MGVAFGEVGGGVGEVEAEGGERFGHGRNRVRQIGGREKSTQRLYGPSDAQMRV